jgi:hypothetical protein
MEETFNDIGSGMGETFNNIGSGIQKKIQNMKANADERKQHRIDEKNKREQQAQAATQKNFKIQEHNVGVGQDAIASGLSAVSSGTSGVSEVIQGAGSVNAGVNAVVKMADEVYVSHGSPASSELRSTINVEALADRVDSASVNHINASNHLEGVESFYSANSGRQDDYYKNFLNDFENNNKDAVSKYASMQGIYQITDNMKKDYEATMSNANLSNEEKTKKQQEYYDNRQKYDNAYRYLNGDTSVKADAYENVRKDIEKQSMYQNVAACANDKYYNNTTRKKYLKEHGFTLNKVNDQDKKYQQDMYDIANTRNQYAKEADDAALATEMNEMRNMTAYDKTAYYQAKFDKASDRYEKSMNANDKAKMNAAQFDMRTYGDDLRSSVSELRKKITDEVNKKND